MLTMIMGVLKFIPGLSNFATTWLNDKYNAQVTEYTARLQVNEEQAAAIIAMEQAVQTRWWFVAAIPPLMALPFVGYLWKSVFWDNVVLGGEGSTPALHGDLQTIFIMILSYYFIKGFSTR